MSAMQNKPKSNFYSSRDFTATTIDAFKLTGKSLRLIDFNSISFLRGNWNWDLRIQLSFESTLQMQSTSIIVIGSFMNIKFKKKYAILTILFYPEDQLFTFRGRTTKNLADYCITAISLSLSLQRLSNYYYHRQVI